MKTSSRRLWAVALFAALVVLAVNIAWWLFYQRTEQMLDDQLNRRLEAVAASAAVAVDSTMVDGLREDDLDDFLKVAGRFERIRRADSLADVFILNDQYRYLFTTSLEPDSIYLLAPLNGPYIDSAFFSLPDEAVATPLYRSGTVYLKSAFAPIYDSYDLVTAVVGVEASVDYFDVLSDLRTNLYLATGLSIAGGLIFGLVFFLFQRQVNHAEQRMFLNETHAYLGRMVAVVSHEIKNPLMIIRASAERLSRKQPSDETGYIVEETDRLNRIVTGYLSFAGSGEASFLAERSPEEFHLGELVQSIQSHFHGQYRDHDIHWLDLPVDSTINMHGYRSALRQVLLNLLINGADACLSSGKSVEVGIGAKSDGDKVRIDVVDHGSGMSREVVKTLFEPFRTTKTTGSGLGLYLSRKIVGEMRGTIDIDSKPGSGTTVIVTLPKEVE